MNVVGLVTARGGSKGVPGKNIALVGGRPLLEYTAEAALRSRRLTRIVLSTDDDEIAAVGRNCGLDVPFMRPTELAEDSTSSLDVALHAMDWLATAEALHTDILVVLQPTSPFRTSTHIDEALNIMLEDEGVDTVVSVTTVPHHFNPFSLMQLTDDKRLVDYISEPDGARYRRQSLPTFLARNGPVVLASRASVIRRSHSFYGANVKPYLMTADDSLDIDTPHDLLVADLLMEHRTGNSAR